MFLDEIEATSPAMQVKLLRILQTGEIRAVGENTPDFVNVRLTVSTNQDLSELVGKGLFREDLFYRINVFPITLAPLRERQDDIPLLIRYFLEMLALKTGKTVRGIDPAALNLLLRYPWPGNIRELENEIERAHILTTEGSAISVRSLSPKVTHHLAKGMEERDSYAHLKLKDAVDDLEKRMVREALEVCAGNRSLAAKRLGLSRQGLINKIAKFGFKEL